MTSEDHTDKVSAEHTQAERMEPPSAEELVKRLRHYADTSGPGALMHFAADFIESSAQVISDLKTALEERPFDLINKTAESLAEGLVNAANKRAEAAEARVRELEERFGVALERELGARHMSDTGPLQEACRHGVLGEFWCEQCANARLVRAPDALLVECQNELSSAQATIALRAENEGLKEKIGEHVLRREVLRGERDSALSEVASLRETVTLALDDAKEAFDDEHVYNIGADFYFELRRILSEKERNR